MNFSISEMLVVLLIALIVIKPADLPKFAHSAGKLIKGLKDIMGKVKKEMNEFIETANKTNGSK